MTGKSQNEGDVRFQFNIIRYMFIKLAAFIKHVFCLTKDDLFSNAKTIEDVYKTQNKYMHFTDLCLYVPISKNHIGTSVIRLYFFNSQTIVSKKSIQI